MLCYIQTKKKQPPSLSILLNPPQLELDSEAALTRFYFIIQPERVSVKSERIVSFKTSKHQLHS